MFVKHPMSEKLTRSCSGELACSPRVPMSLPLMLHPKTICFVGYDGMFYGQFKNLSKNRAN